jgi:hypothetical protein
VYDMYEWSPPDTPSDGNGRAVPGSPRRAVPVAAATAVKHPQESAATAAQAVQVALDRRDNGGCFPGEA